MTWYTLEIIYEDTGAGTMIFRKRNMTGPEVMRFREGIFAAGLFIPDEDKPATEGVIIPPWQIKKIYSFMQDKKFE